MILWACHYFQVFLVLIGLHFHFLLWLLFDYQTQNPMLKNSIQNKKDQLLFPLYVLEYLKEMGFADLEFKIYYFAIMVKVHF